MSDRKLTWPPRPTHKPIGHLALWAALISQLLGCAPDGPPSAARTSQDFPTLRAREAFLRQYFRPKRDFETLHFYLRYQNNSGGLVPGPSDWDIRLVATVPRAELGMWSQGLQPCEQTPDLSWLEAIPQVPRRDFTQWYCGAGPMIVGIEPGSKQIAYRSYTR